jgi:exodeoxyribonuclease VII large subunit
MNNVINFTTTEIKEYTVSEVSNRLKHYVEREFGYVKIRGEISGLKIAASGHAYFNLKDENAILASTCWRHVIGKMSAKLDEGLEPDNSNTLREVRSQT